MLKKLLPKEHGLLAWVGVPLLGALMLSPCLPTLLAALAVLAGFFSFNALRKEAWPLAGIMLAITGGIGLAALPLAAAPTMLYALAMLGLLILVLAAVIRPHTLPRQPLLEILAIAGLCGMGAVVAVAGGALWPRALLVSAIGGSWLVLGMWKLREKLSAILPKRKAWEGGAIAGVLAVGATIATGFALEAPLAGLVPLLYPLRLFLHKNPTSAMELSKVGMTELGWALGAVALGVLSSQGATTPI